jgi:hypothetical protein
LSFLHLALSEFGLLELCRLTLFKFRIKVLLTKRKSNSPPLGSSILTITHEVAEPLPDPIVHEVGKLPPGSHHAGPLSLLPSRAGCSLEPDTREDDPEAARSATRTTRPHLEPQPNPIPNDVRRSKEEAPLPPSLVASAGCSGDHFRRQRGGGRWERGWRWLGLGAPRVT